MRGPIAHTTVCLALGLVFACSGEQPDRPVPEPVPESGPSEPVPAQIVYEASPDPVRVLYVADLPTWQYRYLKNGLLRVDPRIHLQAFLIATTSDFRQETSDTLRPLTVLPVTEDELAVYDVILIGDVPPEELAPIAVHRERWLQHLEKFVSAGGGVGFLAGPRAMPESYRGTVLEELLPVLLEESVDAERYQETRESFKLVAASPGHPVLRILDDADANRQLWGEGFSGLYGYYPVQGAVDGAETILVHSDDETPTGKRVLAAMGTHGLGRTFFLATDELWRMRNPYGEKYFDKFWRNVVLALSGDR